MNQKSNHFRRLVRHACSTISESHTAIKEKYKDYPVCFIQYMEKGNSLDYVEVGFDKENASLTFIMNKEDSCMSAFIHFFEPKDEVLFIVFLRGFSKYYSYRRKCWMLKDPFYVKIEEDETTGTHFFFHRIANP